MMNEKERLYFDSLMELAESLGHSNQTPLSLSLLCLGHGISFEQKGKIFLEFNKVLRENEFDDLSVALFKKSMEKIVPEANEFSDTVIIGFIKAYAKLLIPELYPFSQTL